MLGIGSSELLLIAVVALVVIGPERLPFVARAAGALFGRARRYANEVRADIQREMELEEITKMRSTFHDAAQSLEKSVEQANEQLRAVERSLASPEGAAPAGRGEIAAARLRRRPRRLPLHRFLGGHGRRAVRLLHA